MSKREESRKEMKANNTDQPVSKGTGWFKAALRMPNVSPRNPDGYTGTIVGGLFLPNPGRHGLSWVYFRNDSAGGEERVDRVVINREEVVRKSIVRYTTLEDLTRNINVEGPFELTEEEIQKLQAEGVSLPTPQPQLHENILHASQM